MKNIFFSKSNLKYWFLFFIMVLMVQIPFAQLSVINNSCSDIYISIGFKKNKHWTAKGWWKIPSKWEKVTLLNNKLDKYYYYFYAESIGKKHIWKEEEGVSFCVSDKKFIAYDSRPCEEKYYKQKFMELSIGEKTSRTFELTCKCTYKDWPNGIPDYPEKDVKTRHSPEITVRVFKKVCHPSK